MSSRIRVPLFAYAVLILAWLYQTRVYIPQLPEIVVTQFDFSGRPTSTLSRDGFRLLSLLLQGGLAGFFLVLAFLFPRIPTSMISMPHPEHWLSGERREASLAFLSHTLLWIGALTFALMIMIFQATIRANLSETVELGRSFWIALGFYIGAIGLLVFKLLERFKLPEESVGS